MEGLAPQWIGGLSKQYAKPRSFDRHHLWILHRLNPLELGVDWKDLV